MPNDNNYNAVRGVSGLFSPLNKIKEDGSSTFEGAEDVMGEYDIDLTDDQIISLTRSWKSNYTKYDAKVKAKQKDSFDYWIGKQYPSVSGLNGDRSIQDNLIFTAVETFIPMATAADPEPVVKTDNTTEGNAVAGIWKNVLEALTDKVKLRIKLKNIVRHWTILFLGVGKIVWNPLEDEMDIIRVNPKDLILDPDATIDEGGVYSGKFLGQYKEDTASTLSGMFPKMSALIEEMAHGELGTKLRYIEWNTPDYLFFTIKEHVLGKFFNPHWNYDGETEEEDPETGAPIKTYIQGKNHFKTPKIPFVFLSVFNMGDHPHDDTSLVHQNLSNQDMINVTLRQIIKNVKRMNNGIALSGDHFTKEQAAEAGQVLEDGGALWIPEGDINKAFQRVEAPPLPSDVYNHLEDSRNQTRDIFGTAGANAAQLSAEDTVEGKSRIQGNDSSRISGGVSEYIEQFSDSVLNWFVQMTYVYYDDKHFVNLIGEEATQELRQLQASNPNRLIRPSVKEGSMIPTDPMSQRTEALELWKSDALDPITLFKKLDFADPKEAAKQLYIWKTAPAMLFGDDPDIQKIQQMQQPTDQPSVSIAFKDLPPSGQIGAAKLAGIQIDPADLQKQEAQDDQAKAALAEKDQAQAFKLRQDVNKDPAKPNDV